MWLKRSTAQNIVIGGAAGAFPPVIGWAAATGHAPLNAWLMFLIIFLWTPPHSWALALYTTSDYAKAGVPMMPVAKGPAATRRQILLYSLAFVPVAVAPGLPRASASPGLPRGRSALGGADVPGCWPSAPRASAARATTARSAREGAFMA